MQVFWVRWRCFPVHKSSKTESGWRSPLLPSNCCCKVGSFSFSFWRSCGIRWCWWCSAPHAPFRMLFYFLLLHWLENWRLTRRRRRRRRSRLQGEDDKRWRNNGPEKMGAAEVKKIAFYYCAWRQAKIQIAYDKRRKNPPLQRKEICWTAASVEWKDWTELELMNRVCLYLEREKIQLSHELLWMGREICLHFDLRRRSCEQRIMTSLISTNRPIRACLKDWLLFIYFSSAHHG